MLCTFDITFVCLDEDVLNGVRSYNGDICLVETLKDVILRLTITFSEEYLKIF